MNLTALNVANIGILVALLGTIPDENYDHTYIDTTTRKCAAGHAADNRGLFSKEVANTNRSWFDRLLGRNTTALVPVTDDDHWSETSFALSAFGRDAWDYAFSRDAFKGVDPANVTREMVIERLKAIAAGTYAEAA